MFGWSSGHGTLRVSGGDPADAYDRSTFRDSLTVGTAVYFGNQAGDGHAEVLDGALAEFSQVVDFGPYAGSTGSLWVGGAGIVVALMEDNTVAQFTCVAGSLLPISFKRVNSTTTTATLMVALYQQ